MSSWNLNLLQQPSKPYFHHRFTGKDFLLCLGIVILFGAIGFIVSWGLVK